MSRGYNSARPGDVVGFGELGGFTTAAPGLSKLAVLPALGTTDIHLVGDDYVPGQLWNSRVGAKVAGAYGPLGDTPLARNSGLPGRRELYNFYNNGTNTSAMYLETDGSHVLVASDQITYEQIVRVPNTYVVENYSIGLCTGGAGNPPSTQIVNVASAIDATGGIASLCTNNAAGIYSGSLAGSIAPAGQYALFTTVINNAAGTWKFFLNGTLTAVQSGSVTGTLQALAPGRLGIGGRWDQANSNFTLYWGGSIVEVMRHREALSDATVATRAAPFNLVRGY